MIRRRRAVSGVQEDSARADQLLFGGPLVYDFGFARHDGKAGTASALQWVRSLPAPLGLVLGLAARADRSALAQVLLAELGQGLSRAFLLLAANRALLQLFAGGPTAQRIHASLPVLVAIGAVSAFSALLSAMSTASTGRLEPRIENAVTQEILHHAVNAQLAAMEDEGFHRILDSARFAADYAKRLIGQGVAVLNSVVSLIAAGGVLATLDWRLMPLLLLIAVPRAWGSIRSARRRYLSIQSWLTHIRAINALLGLLTSKDAAPEVRVHQLGDFLTDQYRAMAERSEAEQTRLARERAGTNLLASALSGAATLITYAVLLLLLIHGQVAIAVAGTAALAIRTGVGSIGTLVTQLNTVYDSSLYVADLAELREVGPRRAIPTGGTPVPDGPQLLELKDVRFTYDGRTEPAVQGISLSVAPGQVVALVGANGAGKTTLAKIICGLLGADDGSMSWGGVDFAAADRATWFSRIALLGQDFERWPLSARCNVLMGDVERPDDDAGIAEAARRAGALATVTALPHGWDTILTRGYLRGADVSGGQWQKIGLARSLFREKAELLVADEPTAALDAASEIDTFRKLRSLAETGKSVILITHRLAATRLADVIYVIDNGVVTESGTHGELLGRPLVPGGYRDLYQRQATEYGVAHLSPPRANPDTTTVCDTSEVK
ncbi:ABC transporter ATP-binding protein [Streptacidiphilus sp. EB103A]|uniref:ABC transporter ATP-binding protein n=1 Tax=Streptacidiphilus sp. EB103A TaxID=3156275 RepID=UPI00351982FB